MTWRLTVRIAPPASRGLSVDVFIPTFNEPVQLVRRTLLATIHMDYPHETWLLDDGNRPEMASLAEDLGVRYLARERNTDAKAGNLNHALANSSAEFIAVFDADHAPQQNFLTHTLGYFNDPAVAFVQTPQDFFNLDSYQHRQQTRKHTVWTEQSLFFRVIQRGKDYWNAAFFCGSCATLRRSALEKIGGFATGTVTEDLHTSIRLHKQGFKSVYHAEPLAFGIAPSSVVPFLQQRIRWGQGAMQVWRQERVLTGSGLTLAQRLNYFASMLTYFDGWQKGLFYIAPVIVLVTGVMPISAFGAEFLLHFIPYYLLTFWAFEEVGRGFGRSIYIEQYNMGRFAAFAWSTLGLFQRHLKFRVTSKDLSQAGQTATFVLPQIAVILLNGLAVPVGIFLFVYAAHLPLTGLAANIIWAGINLALALSVVWFSLRRVSYTRSEYRFPIPLPAKVTIKDRLTLYATVDNISSSGCSFYGAFPRNLEPGSPVQGVLALPAGMLPFQGRVVSIKTDKGNESRAPSVSCHFEWKNPHERDRLDLFLYGSDLQWHLLQLSERVLTPLEWAFSRFSEDGRHRIPSPAHWNTMLYDVDGEETGRLGLVSTPLDNQSERAMITFTPLATGAVVFLRSFTRTEQRRYHLKVTGVRQIQSPVAPIFYYQTELCEAETKCKENFVTAPRVQPSSAA
ncbi:cellulose synthase catalytic subunit [UDP-forming] [Sulfuriferula multivorans]|uniref:cellulose synthase (UDP-forming) n=2 Tax=Sulfuriferula multivorans TaxID=1559896 RepID=A0A401K0R4_9PROT|nr:cellulose synthase catalytic subunit [UDP-forming] [Sulfuriferula multivorans]